MSKIILMPSAQNKILIVEDEYSISQMYKYKLELEGYSVQIAPDGKQGLTLFNSFGPDLILLDLKMPTMGGDEMLEKLRASEKGSEVKVIILTNISKDEAPAKLRFLDVDRYIVKAHYTPKQVSDVIKEILA